MKDESARDKAIENVLGQKLRARATPGNGCPDAEVIAAYFERTLAQKERARWETHFDSCAACQQRIAAMVRMDEASEASITHPSAKPAPQPRKRFLLRWAWAVPVLLVVLVAGLWYTGEFDQVLNRHAGTQEPAPKTVATSAKPAEAPAASNKDSGTTSTQEPKGEVQRLQSALKAPATAPADELKQAANAPASGLTQKKLATPPALSPAPPAAAMDVEADRKLKERETVPTTSGTRGAPASTRELPLNGRNFTSLEKAQTAVSSPAQASSSTAGAGAPQDRLAQAPTQPAPEASTTGGAAGGVLGKAENAPAPPAPPPQGANAKFDDHSLRGGISSKAEARPMRFKAGQPTPVAPPENQASFGTVRGRIRDASGAAIPGATVVAINNSTNVAKLLTANEAGEYAANLNPGEYTLEAAAQGFKSSTVKDLPLQARADRQLDFSLQVGAVTQMVTVEAAAPTALKASPLWRVGPRGLIQKRYARGEWETVPSGVTVDLLSFVFPTREVGWAVGKSGTVLRSANGGESWGRVTSPTDEDLVRVRATSAESAEVITRSGAVFVTTDGAATWTRVETAR